MYKMLISHLAAKRFVDARKHIDGHGPGIVVILQQMATHFANLTGMVTTLLENMAPASLLSRATDLDAVCDTWQPVSKGGKAGAAWHTDFPLKASDSAVCTFLAQTLDQTRQLDFEKAMDKLVQDGQPSVAIHSASEHVASIANESVAFFDG